MLDTILYIICIGVSGFALDRFIVKHKYGKFVSFVLANMLMLFLSMCVFALTDLLSNGAWDKGMEAALWLVLFSAVFFIGSAVYAATAKTEVVQLAEGGVRPKSSNRVLYIIIGVVVLLYLPFFVLSLMF